MTNNNYTAESIQTLDGITHIRTRPSMYVGSVESAGLHHILLEIISNSIDEYLNGNATLISVELLKNGGVKVSDNGRGVPIGTHESGCSLLEAAFGIVNTGAKYDDSGESGYNSSGGINGVGAKATNALSSFFEVTSFREGQQETVTFKKGVKQNYNISAAADKKQTGVVVEFIPDATVLNCTTFDWDKIYKQLEELSYLCKGLTIIFSKEGQEDTVAFYSENGLLDYVNNLNSGVALNEPFYCNTEGLEIALLWNLNNSYTYRLYTNNIPQYKGTHHTGFKTALTSEINKYAKEKGLIKDKDTNLQGSDLEEGQIVIISLRLLNPMYEGQNKENLTSAEARTIVQRIASQEIAKWLRANPKDAKEVIEKALVSKKAREAAKKARAAVKAKTTPKKAALKMPSKLADAYSSVRSKCELLIVEGDSAAGGMKLARDNETQAILPVRGKILNSLKAPIEKILGNAEIVSMVEAFGFSIDKKGIYVDLNQFRYGRVIIASDADPDGSHIQSLFYTFIWTHIPELIEQGYLYVSIPPLYKIALNNKYTYLKDERALEDFKASHVGKKYLVKRLKGLGEMNPEDLEETILNPESRTLKQVTITDAQKTTKLFNDLMGTEVNPRKKYIETNSDKIEVYV